MTFVGANRRKLDAMFRRLGGTVTPVFRTGEVVYRHPSFPRPIKINGRRKDCPRLLTKFVTRLAEAVV